MLLKINQFKEFDLISLRSENQFRFPAVEAHLKGFRMGYSYYHLDQEGRGLFYFRRALEALPGDKDTEELIGCFKGQVQNLFALAGEFFPPFMVPVFFHKTANMGLRSGEWEISGDDVRIRLEQTGEKSFALFAYCEKLLPLLSEEEGRAWWMLTTLTDQVS